MLAEIAIRDIHLHGTIFPLLFVTNTLDYIPTSFS